MNELHTSKKVTRWRITSFILLLIIIAGASGGYWYYHTTTTSLSHDIKKLQDERDALHHQLNEQQSADTKHTATNTAPNTTYTSHHGATLTVTTPTENSTITSPLKVTGIAPGNWFQEGSFQAQLKDSGDTVVATGQMTMASGSNYTKPAHFSGELHWSGELHGPGVLVLEKANPSGLPANADTVEIAIRF